MSYESETIAALQTDAYVTRQKLPGSISIVSTEDPLNDDLYSIDVTVRDSNDQLIPDPYILEIWLTDSPLGLDLTSIAAVELSVEGGGAILEDVVTGKYIQAIKAPGKETLVLRLDLRGLASNTWYPVVAFGGFPVIVGDGITVVAPG